MTPRLLPLVLALVLSFPVSTYAQKAKDKTTRPDISLDEQRATVSHEHAQFETVIMHEGDTVIFSHRFRRPGKTSAQLIDLSREALLETFGAVPSAQIVTNGRDRLMFRTLSTVSGVHPTLPSHSDVTEIINIVTRGDTLYIMARFFGYSITIDGWDGFGHPKTNTEHRPLSSFYPINQAKADTNPLASWIDIRPHYLDIYNHLRRIKSAITNADPYLPN